MVSFINAVPPNSAAWQSTFGYVKVGEDDVYTSQEKKWVCLNNIANALSYILSPIVGLIRLVVSAHFLAKNKDSDGQPRSDEGRNYLKAQIVRGVAELFGAGYLMWIPDIITTACMHSAYFSE